MISFDKLEIQLPVLWKFIGLMIRIDYEVVLNNTKLGFMF